MWHFDEPVSQPGTMVQAKLEHPNSAALRDRFNSWDLGSMVNPYTTSTGGGGDGWVGGWVGGGASWL